MKFLVSQTYAEVTPESAEYGDFSDTGFVFEDQVYTLSELTEYITRNGFFRDGRGTNWFETQSYTACFHTGTDRTENLHIKLIK